MFNCQLLKTYQIRIGYSSKNYVIIQSGFQKNIYSNQINLLNKKKLSLIRLKKKAFQLSYCHNCLNKFQLESLA